MLVKHCDICNCSEDVSVISYCYDRQMDAAGSMEDVCETYDLCKCCELRILKSSLNVYIKNNQKERFKLNNIIIRKVKDAQRDMKKK